MSQCLDSHYNNQCFIAFSTKGISFLTDKRNFKRHEEKFKDSRTESQPFHDCPLKKMTDFVQTAENNCLCAV